MGQDYSIIWKHYKDKPYFTDERLFKKVLKGQIFTKKSLKTLWDNIESPLKALQRTVSINHLFTISPQNVINDYINEFINQNDMIPEYLQYLDILVKKSDQADRVIGKYDPQVLYQVQLTTYGEISWKIAMMKDPNSNAIIKWIDGASKKNQDRAIKKAQDYIKFLSYQLYLQRKVFAQVQEAKKVLQTHLIGMHKNSIYSVCISNDEKFVASGGFGKDIILWDLHNKESQIIGQHEDYVKSLCFSSNGQFLVSGSIDQEVKLWNLEDQTNQVIGKHNDWVYSVCISNDNTLIASGSEDKSIRLWNLQDRSRDQIIGIHEGSVWSVCISNNQQFVISGGDDNQVMIWYLNETQNNKVIGQHQDAVRSVCITGGDNLIISGGNDRIINLWDLEDLSKSKILGRHDGCVRSVCASDVFVVSGGDDNTIRLWNLQDQSQNQIIEEVQKRVSSVSISRNNKFIISGEFTYPNQSTMHNLALWAL